MSQIELKAKLLGSLLFFTQTFYKLRTGRDFKLSNPAGNESHFITICRELTKVHRLETLRLIANCPPGWGKSELCKNFVAWAMAHNPDSAFLYLSYSSDLATTHTYGIKQIMELPAYKKLFDIEIAHDSKAKDNFSTTQGGIVAAYGSLGSITGHNAGLPAVDRFSGAILMDDMHKPMEVHSDTIRQSVIDNYNQTIKPRPRSPMVPIVFIGQRLHEDDLPAFLINGNDGNTWKHIELQALDEVTMNARYPEVHSRTMLLREKESNPYVYSSQYQQNPQPAGGSLFKESWFTLLDEEPEIISTFITGDTAETSKDYNDATVFSFWGLYKIKWQDIQTEIYGLHWIDCIELRVEPKDLQAEFLDFYASCMRHPTKPEIIAIEKKSTGATLLSVLSSFQGLNLLNIERTKASGNKTTRFLEAQPFVAKKIISFHRYAKHAKMCITHCAKITANNAHRFDDIADTLYDAIKIALIDKIIINRTNKSSTITEDTSRKIADKFNQLKQIRMQR